MNGSVRKLKFPNRLNLPETSVFSGTLNFCTKITLKNNIERKKICLVTIMIYLTA